jgi:hypothetical protein
MTDALTQKKIAKTKYQDAKRSALRSYDQQKLAIDIKQKVFEDFYTDMVKVSPDFELVKTQNSLDYKVWVNSFPVETLTLNYFDYEIKYTGKLPEVVSRGKIRIDVSEHYVTPRGSWRQTNLGFKIKTLLGYNEESPYYKSGRTVAKKVIEYVDSLWAIEKDRLLKQDIRSRAFTELIGMFSFSKVDFGTPTTPNDPNTFTITNVNKTKIILGYRYRSVNDKIEFIKKDIIVPKEFNLTSLVEKLGEL